MSGGEVLHRTKIALRNKFFRPKYLTLSPREAFEHFFHGSVEGVLEDSNLNSLVYTPSYADTFHGVVLASKRLVDGYWSLFGKEVDFSFPPNWRKNLWTGEEWPNTSSSTIDYHDISIAGGPKYTWEVGRLTYVPNLALAYRVTGENQYAELAVALMDDFAEKNPIFHGIHQTSGIEMSVRTIACTYAIALLGEYAIEHPEKLLGILGLMAQQVAYCRDHLSIGSSGNNHLIAELSAAVLMGSVFPKMVDADLLASHSLKRLEEECLRQINDDGSFVEQSFGYIPFILELFLYAFLAAEKSGKSIRADVLKRLESALEFVRTARLPNGLLPQIGDEDDGCILLAYHDNNRYDLVGNALSLWLESDALSHSSNELSMLLFGRKNSKVRVAVDGEYKFLKGGYTIWRSSGIFLTLDHGPLGWGTLAAHGHADALSITLYVNETPFIVDPGVSAYHENPSMRDRFRSTAYHSTVIFDEKNQSEILGPFMWGKRANVYGEDDGWECQWPTGERHWRWVEVKGKQIEISDRVMGQDPFLVFVLHPSVDVSIAGSTVLLRSNNDNIKIEAVGIVNWQIINGEYSKRFGHCQETKRLVARISEGSCRTKISVLD